MQEHRSIQHTTDSFLISLVKGALAGMAMEPLWGCCTHFYAKRNFATVPLSLKRQCFRISGLGRQLSWLITSHEHAVNSAARDSAPESADDWRSSCLGYSAGIDDTPLW